MTGGLGNDTYVIEDTTDVVVEAAAGGTDLVQSSVTIATLAANVENLTLLGAVAINATGNTLANIITGNTAANLLSGGDGNDTLNGGDGDDTLDGGLGNDSMVGGLGNDTFVVNAATDVTVEAASGGTDTVQSSITLTLGAELENLTLTGTAAINGAGNGLANILSGSAGANNLVGGAGNDTVLGGDGNDTIDGGTGTDSMTGGLGNDIYVIDATSDAIVEAAAGGTDLVQSSVTVSALAANVENLTLLGAVAINATGNTLANIITGNTAANLLSSGDGNDTLNGGEGNDTLDGGLGNDSMVGGLGNDTFVIDAATDVTVEAAAGGTDTVQSSVTFTLGAELENLTLTGTTAINATGNGLANIMTGNSGANNLVGGAGNDTVLGGDGNDTIDGGAGTDSMTGGLGDDTYIVDATTDIVVEAASGGTDTVSTSVVWTLGTNVERLIQTGTTGIAGTGNTLANSMTGNSGANNLSGLAGNDTITGAAGNDTLLGADGDDTLDGGTGNDSMTGGLGDDAYVVDATTDIVVEAASGGTDTVSTSVVWTLGTNVERLIQTGTTGIAGTGNTLANSMTGNSGANNLSGLDGNDTLLGGAGNDSLTGGLGADQFVFNSTASGVDVISDFNELNGGGEEGDVLRFEGLSVGAFAYRGTAAFTGGSDNSEARISGTQVLVDSNGDGIADITMTLTGLTSAAQLAASDFVFV